MMPPLVLTMGEPAGIGGEITLKSFIHRDAQRLPPFFILDAPSRLQELAKRLNLKLDIAEIKHPTEVNAIFSYALPVLPINLAKTVEPGQPNTANATAVIDAIDRAVEFVQAGHASALVTNPIHKSVLLSAGFRHAGHTEYLAELVGGTAVMMLAGDSLRVVPVTGHVSLRDAITQLSVEKIITVAEITISALQKDFGIVNPRLAVAGLNPHAGEAGKLGRDEIDILRPAVQAMQMKGLNVVGPMPPDTMFHASARANYDAALCMYHDQALIPLKTLHFDNAVNVTLGLKIIRTSPDHGTAFDIAGTGQANPASLIAAIQLAAKLAQNRK